MVVKACPTGYTEYFVQRNPGANFCKGEEVYLWGSGMGDKPLWSMTGRCTGREESLCIPPTEIRIEMISEYDYSIIFFLNCSQMMAFIN